MLPAPPGGSAREVGPASSASHHLHGSPVNDTLLTLDQARVALIGEAAAERSNAWPSIKTLRRAYSAGQLAVVQPAAGGRVMVWRSELMRWASAPRTASKGSADAPPRAPRPAPPSRPARKQPAAPAPTATASRPRNGLPPRLSLDELKAA
jgi:hypothetical protein